MGAWCFVEPYLEWVLDAGRRQVEARRAMPAARPRPRRRRALMSKHLAQLQSLPRRGVRGLRFDRDLRDSHGSATGRTRGHLMTIEIRVPTLGESVTEATIGRWFKKAGDAVSADEPLVELETDKVTARSQRARRRRARRDHREGRRDGRRSARCSAQISRRRAPPAKTAKHGCEARAPPQLPARRLTSAPRKRRACRRRPPPRRSPPTGPRSCCDRKAPASAGRC